MERNCNVVLASMAKVGLKLQRAFRKLICPHCHNKIGGSRFEYRDKNIWHKSCLESMDLSIE